MSTNGMMLISRIIRSAELAPVIEYGITSDDFPIAVERSYFDTIMNYYAVMGHGGAVLGPNMMRERFPQIELCDDFGMTVQALCEEVRKRRFTQDMKEVGDSILTALENGGDPMQVIDEAQSRITRLQGIGLSKATDVTFGAAFNRILNRYEARKKGLLFSNLTWPWEILNERTGGLQDDDYVIFYGRPKSMKSWVLAALVAHAFNCGVPALLYTKEMLPDNILMRVAAIALGLPYQEFRMSLLEDEQETALYQMRDFVEEISRGGNDKLVCLSGQDVQEGGDTMGWLRAKIERYKPAVVFIDGLYLMSDGSKKATADWTRVTSISRAGRQLQLAMRIPFIATVQANRRAAQHSRAELDEIAYADALGQDATIAARVIAERHQPTIALVMGGSREFQLDGFRIGGVPATDFSYKEELTSEDVNNAKNNDKDAKEKEKADGHARAARTPRKPRGGVETDMNAEVQRAMQGVVTGAPG
jgi:replicative DNA helicase